MERFIPTPRALALAFAAWALLSAPSRSCQADLILIPYSPNGPSVTGANGTLSYNASSTEFQASVQEPANDSNFNSLIFVPAGQPTNLVFLDPANGGASLVIDLKVDANGNFLANGTGVTLTGAVDVDGDSTDDASGTLLTGKIVAFGAQQAGPAPLDFDGLFQITGGLLTQAITLSGGGTLAPQFQVGATAGFNVEAENVTSGILGNFSQSFSSSLVKPSSRHDEIPTRAELADDGVSGGYHARPGRSDPPSPSHRGGPALSSILSVTPTFLDRTIRGYSGSCPDSLPPGRDAPCLSESSFPASETSDASTRPPTTDDGPRTTTGPRTQPFGRPSIRSKTAD